MSLTALNIEKVSNLIINELIDKKLITLKDQRDKVRNRIMKVITDDQKNIEALDKEVRMLIEKNKGIADSGSIDYNKMFNIIKVKLAKEKGIVL